MDSTTTAAAGETYAFPLSAQQRRLWFAQQFDPTSAMYNMPFILELHGELDRAALERALSEIVRRHEALRTTFTLVGEEPRQEVHPPRPLPLPLVDLSGLSETARAAVVEVLRRAECDRALDLERGPLLRVRLLMRGARSHELHLVMHHIVSDGWSEGVLLRELTALYEAYSHGRRSPLPELAVQYADYTLWQLEQLRGEAYERQLDYWRRKLAGLPALELPREPLPPAALRGRGEMLVCELPLELSRALRQLARREGVTLFVLLLSAFKLLLARYSGQRDFAVGTIVANRNQKETEELIGFFVDNVVLRTDLRGRPSFRELLKRVERTTLEAYEHQDVPFDRLVEALNPTRPAGGMPLIQALLVFQNTPGAELRLGELEFEQVSTGYGYSFVDLGLSVREEGERLVGRLMYSTELFTRAGMQRLAGHFERLLEGAVATPDADVERLPLLTPSEREHVVHACNATQAAFAPVPCLHALFEEQAARTPDAVALVSAARSLTFRELNEEANRLAHHLRARGVGPDVRVGLCVERSVEMLVGILGVLKAGGAYVPLDPDHPRERLEYMLGDARPAVLLTQAHLRSRLPAGACDVWQLDAQRPELDAYATHDPRRVVAPDHLVYVIYTSGSTGRPKGVAVPHRGVVNRMQWMLGQYRLEPSDRVLQKTPFSFDVSVWEMFWPLVTGATLVLSRPGDQRDGARIVELVQRHGITHLHFVPSMLRAFLDEPGAAACPSLRRVLCSGEALPPDLQQRFMALCAAELHNLYGPTEASIEVSSWDCRRGAEPHSVPIGHPIANTTLHVLDRALDALPVGLAGELHIGGVGLARGYLGAPALTAERFIPDSFGRAPGARLYKTGDLARRRADGAIEYLGRLDLQVKIRGQRIELGEIEAALAGAPGVRQCAVSVVDAAAGDKRLAAYVVCEPGTALDERALHAHLAAKLPEAMLPSAYVALAALPLTLSGKIDRRALPAPQFDVHGHYVAPRDVLESLLAGIWAQVLELERVGVHDDFFALGGHSLLATRMVARARGAGLQVSLADLFEARSVARLAERLRGAPGADAALAPPPLAPRPAAPTAPLSHAQQRVWVLEQLQPGRHEYHLPLALRLRGALRLDALRAALAQVQRRHAALRTRFVEQSGAPWQVVSDEPRADLCTYDLTELPPERREAAARALVSEDVRRPFDLAQGAPLRAGLWRLDDDDHVLCVTLHHIVADALSLRIFLEEVATLYTAACEGHAARLPELPLQYADVAAWERAWLRDDTLARHVDYWRRRLDGCASAPGLPTDFPRPAERSFACETLGTLLPPETVHGLNRLARGAAATDFMVLLALFDVWLWRHSGQSDLLVGTPVSNRRHVETEPLIGFFIDTVVLRARLDERASFAAFVAGLRAQALQDYAYQALPFEKLVDELGARREPGRHPLFQVMLNLIGAPEPDASWGALAADDWDAGEAQTAFDLCLTARPSPAGLELYCTYGTELFRRATVEGLLEGFDVLARQAAATPEMSLGELREALERHEATRAATHKRRLVEGRRDALRSLPRRSAVGGARG